MVKDLRFAADSRQRCSRDWRYAWPGKKILAAIFGEGIPLKLTSVPSCAWRAIEASWAMRPPLLRS